MKLEEQVRRLRGSSCQIENWDSYGAYPVADETINAAIVVARRLDGIEMPTTQRKLTRVDPTVDGGISFSDNDESVWVSVTTDTSKKESE